MRCVVNFRIFEIRQLRIIIPPLKCVPGFLPACRSSPAASVRTYQQSVGDQFPGGVGGRFQNAADLVVVPDHLRRDGGHVHGQHEHVVGRHAGHHGHDHFVDDRQVGRGHHQAALHVPADVHDVQHWRFDLFRLGRPVPVVDIVIRVVGHRFRRGNVAGGRGVCRSRGRLDVCTVVGGRHVRPAERVAERPEGVTFLPQQSAAAAAAVVQTVHGLAVRHYAVRVRVVIGQYLAHRHVLVARRRPRCRQHVIAEFVTTDRAHTAAVWFVRIVVADVLNVKIERVTVTSSVRLYYTV